ncbi:DUF1772 domain-containing protein [Dokdonia ponticola]|uniref:DUF1772 domain-containing protein n=1 Tax=Dokdonia ponticola TaxID=2041041 RepID=A0ABV9I3P6_9FLAO
MELTYGNITGIALLLLTGLSAGLCFTWANAITPGIGRMDDLSFLRAFQNMNRTIVNPLFIIVFFGPFFLSPLHLYTLKNVSSEVTLLLIFAAVCYIGGVVLVTIFGNVPLNNILDKTDLSALSRENLKTLRASFEDRWNRLHLIRTVTAIISFLTLIITVSQSTKQ